MSLYVPPHFRAEDPATLFALIEAHAFGILVTPGPGGLQASHLPFLPERDPEGRVRLLGHLARANDHARVLESAPQHLAIFQGPHAYISPGWYENHPAVPTWNYAVVHAYGRARMMDEAELHDLVIRLSDTYEAGRERPWRAAQLPGPFVDAMLRAITGFVIEVERLEGKFKLSQNRPAEVERVIAALEDAGESDLAALMRRHPPAAKG